MKKIILFASVLLFGITATAQSKIKAEAQYRNMAGWADAYEFGLQYHFPTSFYAAGRLAQTNDYGFGDPTTTTMTAIFGVGYRREMIANLHWGTELDARYHISNSTDLKRSILSPVFYVGFSFEHIDLQISTGLPYILGAGIAVDLN